MTNEKFNGLLVVPKLKSTNSEFELLYTKAKELFGELTSEIMAAADGRLTFTIIFDSPDLSDEHTLKIEELKNINSEYDFHYIFINIDGDFNGGEVINGGLHFHKQGEEWFQYQYYSSTRYNAGVETSELFKMQVEEIINKGDNPKNIVLLYEEMLENTVIKIQ